MTKIPYFYGKEAEGETPSRRTLPDDGFSGGPLFVAAGNAFTPEMRDYLARMPMEDILADVCAPSERTRLRHMAQYFPGLYRLLAEYASEYPRVTVKEPSVRFSGRTVSIVSHCLFFTVGTALRATDAALVDCTLTAEEGDDAITLSLSVARSAATEGEVASAFHLSEREIAVMRTLSDAAGFSIEFRAGETAAIALLIPLKATDHWSMAALTDRLLRRAFFLPRLYFS